MSYVLGLTGGIATGKSTVSRLFSKHGFKIVDADLGARAILEPGTPGLEAVRKLFGDQVLLETGQLDRNKVGQMVFSDPVKRKALDQCLAVYIKEWIIKEKNKHIKNHESLIILDIPLLYEAGYDQEVDEVMVVYVDEQTQMDRLMKRNQLTAAEAKARIAAQIPLSEKARKADTVIHNDGTIAETEAQVTDWLIHKGYYSE